MYVIFSGAQQHIPLWSPELYALGGVPYVGCLSPSVVARMSIVGTLVGVACLWPVCHQVLPHAEVASPLMGGAESPHAWLLDFGGSGSGTNHLVGVQAHGANRLKGGLQNCVLLAPVSSW